MVGQKSRTIFWTTCSKTGWAPRYLALFCTLLTWDEMPSCSTEVAVTSKSSVICSNAISHLPASTDTCSLNVSDTGEQVCYKLTQSPTSAWFLKPSYSPPIFLRWEAESCGKTRRKYLCLQMEVWFDSLHPVLTNGRSVTNGKREVAFYPSAQLSS